MGYVQILNNSLHYILIFVIVIVLYYVLTAYIICHFSILFLITKYSDLVYDNGYIEIDPDQCGYTTFLGSAIPSSTSDEAGVAAGGGGGAPSGAAANA